MSMEFTLNDLQRQRVEDHLALVEQVLRRSIKTNEAVDGMGHDDLYQEGCIALCRAAVSYREEMGAFPAYARTVIRNYLLDRCREIQSARKNLPLLSLDAFAEMGAPEPVSPFHTEDLISDVSSDALLSHFRNRYHGTARLGIEALELRADVIAFQFGVLSLEDVRRRGRFKEGFELPADIVVYVRLRGKGGTQEKPESKKQRPQHGAGEAGRCVFDGL